MPYRISVVFVLTFAMVLLAMIPALTIWSIVFVAMDESMKTLDHAGRESLTNLSGILQEQLIAKFTRSLTLRLQEAEHIAQAHALLLESTGITSMDLHPSPTLVDEVSAKMGLSVFTSVQKSPQLNYLIVRGMMSNANIFPLCNRTLWVLSQALNFDISTGTFSRAVYTSSWALLPDYSAAILDAYYSDQVTGARKVNWTRVRDRPAVIRSYPTEQWFTDVFFNPYMGQMELLYVTKGMPAKNNTYTDMIVSLDVQAMSEELRNELEGNPRDRLFMFFRRPHGHLLAASHGKFYSLSDVDRRGINPLVSPPNASLIFAYTCLNSTDTVIFEACQQLYTAANFSWIAIPEGKQELVLNGSDYWVAVGYTVGLNCSIVHIKYRDTVMGPIEAKKEEAHDMAETWRMWTYVVLALAVFFAVLAALLMGCWLRHELRRMSSDMVRLASLQFRQKRRPSKTLFAEMYAFQKAFTFMEQGLEAFARKLPGTARNLFRNKGAPDDVIGFHVVTVLYANIEGFAAVCQNFPLRLVGTAVSSCTNIITRIVTDNLGAIDKLIGDTVVATFNFPKEHGGHEGDAVESALAIQTVMYDQHSEWVSQGIPALRIRFGIQAGECVIGDAEEGHRLCAGDAMKEAGRLEVLNKAVGTYCLVSEDIYEATKHHIRFRQVFLGSDISFPSAVYEPLCAVLPESPKVILQNAEDSFRRSLTGDPMDVNRDPLFDPPHSPVDRSVSDPMVVYHYRPVKESMLLAHCRCYERAYDQFLASEYLDALQTLRQPVLDGTDLSWEKLKKECTTFYERDGHPACAPNQHISSLGTATPEEDTRIH